MRTIVQGSLFLLRGLWTCGRLPGNYIKIELPDAEGDGYRFTGDVRYDL